MPRRRAGPEARRDGPLPGQHVTRSHAILSANGYRMTFYVVETLFGRGVADETAHFIEYRRDGSAASSTQCG